ncbi:unnamed protein product [Cladocopium goreaui]|uniref:Uncharacterized protein n=1 Tax=Cladocopium goreaui TaxID=2562237 RepID=A0A9P1C477_9DINO|nr:unnamed protein product [Cladocopium goreaui]|mmetsp:Transcript_68776/g.151500  ORF Transcript_68776/g.151500 Transcript_68776/m.151500 type:complete len:103 (-) Transcript_68776:75-383(-)
MRDGQLARRRLLAKAAPASRWSSGCSSFKSSHLPCECVDLIGVNSCMQRWLDEHRECTWHEDSGVAKHVFTAWIRLWWLNSNSSFGEWNPASLLQREGRANE